MAATTTAEPAELIVGSDSVLPRRGGTTDPGGTVHAVHGWMPLCGGSRVRFVFPGRDPQSVKPTCPDCAAAVTAAHPTQESRVS